MDLPVNPPVKPMLAKAAKALPEGDGWQFEPKWDGFRCIVFRDGDEVELGSRNERPLTRYFPELLDPIRSQLPERVVLDGEIVIATPGGLDFDALQLRLHPAESRVRKLAAEIPASFVAFDLLACGDVDARSLPLSDRWRLLCDVMADVEPPLYVSPSTLDREQATDWFTRFEGAGLDGVVAKRLDSTYQENVRVHTKVKHDRTADCVVAGFRWHKSGPIIGSLLLGLYDDAGKLNHIGVIGAFPMKTREELVSFLSPYREGALENHPWREWAVAAAHTAEGAGRMPGGQSRWNAKKDLSWEPLRPELVVEIAYDQLQGDRLRHAGQFRRWRPDKSPSDCRYDQLEAVVPSELAEVFGTR
ncbi:MAG TPA: ATP-dependent DNA ligase [Acidimicrobiales bacterium]|jgi:ATP-dependent DNA ligase|nr:ATP-dependent DNA ligase [Acidimicrobiales bacterium]